ncbi:hypothetical protein OU415_20960 [Saccharopolyspora sp. WRP15-2]|uniref:DUF222 domain-containing protein n=1 Tax=Saccharopolyspora oryzae TaxID=2997343 RepID=A0ABT4V3Q4_9PSEU|nr:hypothetical protein [Saccharopolyspora oryzae]MDA3627917.1 hypothetical protein [Saccharopolyspora oryzae]
MFVWEQGVFMPAEVDAKAGFEALDGVLLHLAAEMPDRLATMIGNQLDSGDVLGASLAMAAFAARRELLVSREDRRILREAIESHRGDTTSVDRLDLQVADTGVIPVVPPQAPPRRQIPRQPARHAATRRTVPMRIRRPERQVDPAEQTIMMPAIRA